VFFNAKLGVLKVEVEYLMRCKLPSSASFHASPSGDTEYEIAYRDAIFKNKPQGFEVSWVSSSTWPVDKDGFTWVKLYCTDGSKALEYYIDKCAKLEKKIEKAKAKIAEINL